MSPSRWIKETNAKGIISKRGKYGGGTFAHPDIALEFATWIDAKYRGKGLGEQGLLLLCEAAKANEVEILYDNIAIDNQAIKLFLKSGFYEEYRTDEIIMLKKEL